MSRSDHRVRTSRFVRALLAKSLGEAVTGSVVMGEGWVDVLAETIVDLDFGLFRHEVLLMQERDLEQALISRLKDEGVRGRVVH
jgi:hypothetical protein